MPRPKIHDEALRTRLLDRTGELLSAHGPDALSLRRLAADVNTSTTAVYSLFGGKAGLVAEVHREAWRRFGARLAEVTPSDDPARDLVALGHAYRASALADPHLYGLLFGSPVPDYTPDQETREESMAAFRPLLDAVRRGVDCGQFAADPPERMALACWGQVHGLVSLELNGSLPEDVDVEGGYDTALRALVEGWRRRP
ncbi:transcriptional regulator, TetR family [Streptoalloteichus tenebrarius]|uniref:Transcriptional regulator, TetR family n=1 Tax=Streptoalloteichus tenebrarius (strain ATCC 17920 / DSM 40477 / JCM 4838 / CBS 697.72 / NBRC 16177 / NCIMB 11028 / NRRL B-12390 / A12253. 1 / ISP 5477) TaxID=1933 RepID=A0ABT1HY79_STRSD|nr:TetR/AcrR family transcriptional regulator [Streptoalloteichus tenebrarius]MCP2260470.1 transcriptional regulator, TetR family [Streptoalloteichus tenebrarius]BFF02734.1 TetR/AcrR family transcriptional regulator [Streptoalloteichus tenebrarius]